MMALGSIRTATTEAVPRTMILSVSEHGDTRKAIVSTKAPRFVGVTVTLNVRELPTGRLNGWGGIPTTIAGIRSGSTVAPEIPSFSTSSDFVMRSPRQTVPMSIAEVRDVTFARDDRIRSSMFHGSTTPRVRVLSSWSISNVARSSPVIGVPTTMTVSACIGGITRGRRARPLFQPTIENAPDSDPVIRIAPIVSSVFPVFPTGIAKVSRVLHVDDSSTVFTLLMIGDRP